MQGLVIKWCINICLHFDLENLFLLQPGFEGETPYVTTDYSFDLTGAGKLRVFKGLTRPSQIGMQWHFSTAIFFAFYICWLVLQQTSQHWPVNVRNWSWVWTLLEEMAAILIPDFSFYVLTSYNQLLHWHLVAPRRSSKFLYLSWTW